MQLTITKPLRQAIFLFSVKPVSARMLWWVFMNALFDSVRGYAWGSDGTDSGTTHIAKVFCRTS